jgi:hypothetical protein
VGTGPSVPTAAQPYGEGDYESLDFDMSDDDPQEPAPAGNPASPVTAEATLRAGEQSDDGTGVVSDVDADFALSDAALSHARELRSGGPWAHKIGKRTTTPDWDPPAADEDPIGLVIETRETFEVLARACGYQCSLSERLRSQWCDFARALYNTRPAVARPDMPPLDASSRLFRECLEQAPTGVVSPSAWAHFRACCVAQEYVELARNPAYFLGHVHWGYGLILVPRVIVSPHDGSPRLIAHLYTAPKPTTRHSWSAADVSNGALRNLLLRWVITVASTLSLSSQRGMDEFYYVHRIWHGMTVDWTGSSPPAHQAEWERDHKLKLDAYGCDLDDACARAGLTRRCGMTFGVDNEIGRSLDPQLLLSLLRGIPCAQVLSTLQEACVGRLLAAAHQPTLAPEASGSERFVNQLFRLTGNLAAEWQRVRLFDLLLADGYRGIASIYKDPHPIRPGYMRFQFFDPGTHQESRSALPSDDVLRQHVLRVLEMHPQGDQDWSVTRTHLQRFRADTENRLLVYMPPGVYNPANTSQWYNCHGDLNFGCAD